MWIWSLAWEDPLKKEMATHSRIIARKIQRTEKPGGSQRVGHDWETEHTQADWVVTGGPARVVSGWSSTRGIWQAVLSFVFIPRTWGDHEGFKGVCVSRESVCILHTFSCCLRDQRHRACDSAGSRARLVWTMVQLLGRPCISLQVNLVLEQEL